MQLLGVDYTLLTDPLSLFFLFVVLLVSAPAAVYSVGYMRGEYGRGKKALLWALLAAFVLSMALVVTSGNALVFLVAWELMSLASYFLVVIDHRHERSVMAGTIYIVMTHIGTAVITAALLIMSNYAESFDIAAMKAASASIPANIKDLIFILFLIGFGTKAGIVPLHVWLPYAHPQAPSHISSIMSGVMIKTAVYGMLRFVFMTLGIGPQWWGNLVLLLALVSCLAGIMYALMEHDLKKLLAYSSVENMGIIMLGIGASMVFMKMGMPALAVMALCAGLFHLLNHAVFKGLLFLGAGAVYKATGTRNIEHLGGLIKRMPVTAAAFLAGSVAISGLPPFNGFVSEWLTLQAFFYGAANSGGSYKIFLCVCAALLALTGGLAAACFVKAFGITFLALPRSKAAQSAQEAPLSMKAPMAFLAATALALGLGAPFAVKYITGIAGFAIGAPAVDAPFSFLIKTNWIAAAVLVFAASCCYAARNRRAAECNTWDCGYYKLSPRNEYSATAFSKPLRIAFSFFLMPYSKTEKIRDSFYHVRSFKYEVFTTPVFRKYIYAPAVSLLFVGARKLKKIQPGSIHVYVAYIFVTIVLLVIFMGRF
ncbi:MAG TPA: proton-conducting transporter membrane subunit [Candidatus Omnitrophota bacterium]|nr:proton-conducting transporter membrane subunit [Candidatus Omnitrophota bacterium]HPN66404.1 proton-conducting transporter membrane subunit [Candidatus Omnitrophota bacterium]